VRKGIHYHIFILGGPFVGKTSLLLSLVGEEWGSEEKLFQITPGAYRSKFYKIDEREVELRIHDTGGIEKQYQVSTGFFNSAQGIILVYDVTNGVSFTEHLFQWKAEMDRLLDIRSSATSVPVLLAGNKSDLEEYREIPTHAGRDQASDWDIDFFETSAVTGKNVEHIFLQLAQRIYFQNKDNTMLESDIS